MKQLKVARERSKLTQAELAERLGTTQQTIARWEAGKAEPNLAALRDLAICLGTSVDALVGRESAFGHQTTNPSAWITGDNSGYWGNIGVRSPGREFSVWYPVTTSTREQMFMRLQDVEADTWLSFQTLNNKMVICRPSQALAITFLDEAEDQIEGDWDVGPADVEGWPQEFYECLEHLMWEQMGAGGDECGFSEKLLSVGRNLIEEYELDDDKLMKMCLKTRIVYRDGTARWIYASDERLANAMFDFEIGIENSGSMMLHLDDNGGDHSVFLSLEHISLIEFPLIPLIKGVEKQYVEDERCAAASSTSSTVSADPQGALEGKRSRKTKR